MSRNNISNVQNSSFQEPLNLAHSCVKGLALRSSSRFMKKGHMLSGTPAQGHMLPGTPALGPVMGAKPGYTSRTCTIQLWLVSPCRACPVQAWLYQMWDPVPGEPMSPGGWHPVSPELLSGHVSRGMRGDSMRQTLAQSCLVNPTMDMPRERSITSKQG
jgi:hypothetical protein